MFEGYRYRLAKNSALMVAADKSLISSDLALEMRRIAYNKPNREYGVSLLKSGTCDDKFAAAAAVFARLSIIAKRNNTFMPGEVEWDIACREAMVLGGAPFATALLGVDELKEIIEESHYGGGI